MSNNPFKNPATTKKIAYAGAGIVIVAALVFGLYSFLDHKYRVIVADFATSIQPDWNLAYDSIDVSPFAGSVTLHQANMRYKGEQLLRAETITLGNLASADNQLTRASVNAKNLQFSATGSDLSQVTPTGSNAIIVTGDVQFDYSHSIATNSYELQKFQFASVDQNMSLAFAKGALNNLVLSANNMPQSFDLALQEAIYNGNTKTNPQGKKFSVAFGYDHPTDGGFEVKNFRVDFPEFQQYASFTTAKISGLTSGKLPLEMASEIQGLDMPIEYTGGSADLWKEYGYTRFKADAKFSYNFVAETQIIHSNIALILPEMFTTNLALDLSGVDMASLEQPNAAQMAISYDALKINTAQINYTDASFLKKSLEIYAKRQNIPVADYVAQLGTSLDQALIADPKHPDPAMVDVSGKLKAYLTTLGSLTINMQPASPVPLSQAIVGLLLDRAKLLQIMGTTVTAS